jgi:methionyl-tRNA formyltransferase
LDADVGYRLACWLVSEKADIVVGVLHPEGKGRRQEDIRQLLDGAGVPILSYCPENPSATVSALRKAGLSFDYLACLWFGYLLPPEVLALPRVAGINTHPSYLPYNRGKHGNIWSIIEGTPAGGSVHYLLPGIDNGAVLARKMVASTPADTGKSLYEKCVAATEEAFKEAWRKLAAGDMSAIEQAELGQGTYHNGKELSSLDWIDLDSTMRAGNLLNILRARTFPPHPGVRFTVGGKTYQVCVEITELPES